MISSHIPDSSSVREAMAFPFRRRLIFTEAEPLRRATMPRDGRWWFYEGLRSGMQPSEGDIVPGRKMPA